MAQTVFPARRQRDSVSSAAERRRVLSRRRASSVSGGEGREGSTVGVAMGENSVVRVKMPSKGRGGSGGESEQEIVARTLGGVSGGVRMGREGEGEGEGGVNGDLPSFSHLHVDAAVGVAEADFDSARIVEAAAVEAEVVFEGLEDELALVERGFWFARHGCSLFYYTVREVFCI